MTLRRTLEDRNVKALRSFDGHLDQAPNAACEDAIVGHDHFHICTRRTRTGHCWHRYHVNDETVTPSQFDKAAEACVPINEKVPV